VLELYEADCAASDAVIARTPPTGRPAWWPDGMGPVQSAREIVLHAVTETATHAGHLDIVRESLDGTRYLVLD
jgi:hypothetical protein